MDKQKEREIRFKIKLDAIRQHKKPYLWKVLDKNFIVFPSVFNPGKDSEMLARIMKINKGDNVLDLGTGCGVLGIFAAKNASKVVLTEINPAAAKNAVFNVKKFGLEKKSEVRKGDLFGPIKRSEKFDVIIFNPPFGSEKPKDFLEMGMQDYGYKTLTKLFENIRNYLKTNGRIYIIFSDLGNMEYFKELVKKNKFKVKVLEKLKDGQFTKYIFRAYFFSISLSNTRSLKSKITSAIAEKPC